MMSESVTKLIQELNRLPGIGPKGAQRIAFHVLEADDDEVASLSQALRDVKANVGFCAVCGNLAERGTGQFTPPSVSDNRPDGDGDGDGDLGAAGTGQPLCLVCANPNRSDDLLCVVEEAKDVVAMERTGEFRGRYHVLGGVIDPISNVGPDQLNIASLFRRLRDGTTSEVVLATNPNVHGEATAAYLSRLLAPLGVTVSRLALGLPVGGDLEYADEITLGRAFAGRRPMG